MPFKPAIILLLLGLLFTAAACTPDEDAVRDRRPFDSFALERFDGDSISLADLKGKVSLVVFWASWCPGCQAELPLLDSLAAAVRHDEFAVIAINDEWNEGAARGYAAAKGFTLPLLLGRGEMWQRYRYLGLPYTVLLDRQGRVIEEYYGYPGRRAFDEHVAGRALAELGSRRGSFTGGI